jgi:hypothetical protein
MSSTDFRRRPLPLQNGLWLRRSDELQWADSSRLLAGLLQLFGIEQPAHEAQESRCRS